MWLPGGYLPLDLLDAVDGGAFPLAEFTVLLDRGLDGVGFAYLVHWHWLSPSSHPLHAVGAGSASGKPDQLVTVRISEFVEIG